uniref:Secreted protein n=1 Tax=Pyxicephalus adspersus TaxID=30357 RepID=A0AAV3ANC0_PYXAD|nr:TPA: hypothetical protein GDO54_011933 [Pyxicephalus adspersus]
MCIYFFFSTRQTLTIQVFQVEKNIHCKGQSLSYTLNVILSVSSILPVEHLKALDINCMVYNTKAYLSSSWNIPCTAHHHHHHHHHLLLLHKHAVYKLCRDSMAPTLIWAWCYRRGHRVRVTKQRT